MKIKVKNSYLLAGCVAVLALLCFLSVSSPERFNREVAARETVVRHRLMKIRSAEEKYRARHGAYTGSFDVLVRSGLLADSLRYIPFSGHEPFDLQATAITGKSGMQTPLMECAAEYGQYLRGLDKASVDRLTEEANAAGRFPGLKVGDTETPNNNAGNWE